MKKLFLIGAMSLTFMACERHERTKTIEQDRIERERIEREREVPKPPGRPVSDNYQNYNQMQKNPSATNRYDTRMDMDNTGMNARGTMTPSDQSESQMDRTITQQIRRTIMADDSLSMNAKNIKIITINGVVTLRGPVANSQEKDNIARKVQNLPGVTRVDNQLEITRSNY